MSKSSIAIHLPDGSVKEVPAGTTPFQIANDISPRLAAASVVARITPVNATVQEKAEGGSETSSAEAAMYAAEDASAPRRVDLATPRNEDAKSGLRKESAPEAL
jgi:threonyl-tRNA synthetase